MNCTTLAAITAVFTACLALLPAAGARAQFASGVNLVEVYATVSDRYGEPIQGLTAGDFAVAEDGVPQTITTFAAGEFPLAVALAIDRSFSMAGERLAEAKQAGRVFINALRPADQLMLVAIGSETEVAAPLSIDHRPARAALDGLDAWGTTPLYDSILVAIDVIQPASGRRALVLLSDGVDRFSRATAGEVVEQARRKDVLLYPIAIGKTRPPVFAELAAATGGRSFFLPGMKGLEQTLTTIARELRFQYLLGYAPPKPVSPGWHSIELRVDRSDARVRAREGYFTR